MTANGSEEEQLVNVEVEELFTKPMAIESSAPTMNEGCYSLKQAGTKASTSTDHQGTLNYYQQAALLGHRKFYALAHGRTPGIYTDWASCAREVSKFSGAVYQRFNNTRDAEKTSHRHTNDMYTASQRNAL